MEILSTGETAGAPLILEGTALISTLKVVERGVEDAVELVVVVAEAEVFAV